LLQNAIALPKFGWAGTRKHLVNARSGDTEIQSRPETSVISRKLSTPFGHKRVKACGWDATTCETPKSLQCEESFQMMFQVSVGNPTTTGGKLYCTTASLRAMHRFLGLGEPRPLTEAQSTWRAIRHAPCLLHYQSRRLDCGGPRVLPLQVALSRLHAMAGGKAQLLGRC
jgi:hypothetical protein